MNKGCVKPMHFHTQLITLTQPSLTDWELLAPVRMAAVARCSPQLYIVLVLLVFFTLRLSCDALIKYDRQVFLDLKENSKICWQYCHHRLHLRWRHLHYILTVVVACRWCFCACVNFRGLEFLGFVSCMAGADTCHICNASIASMQSVEPSV